MNELNPNGERNKILNDVYDLTYYLPEQSGEVIKFSECTGYMDWPSKGIYIFFNYDLPRIVDPETPKIVRVGTHGVSEGSSSTLWQRLKAHKGTKDGGGNHRGSVFRKHVGEALLNKSSSLTCDTWGEGKSASSEIRQKEVSVEKEVSRYIRKLALVCIDVDDRPSKHSDRAYLEQNIISLLSGGIGPIDLAHERWLGFSSPHESIRRSSLWNVDHTRSLFDESFVEVLKKYCYYTFKNKKKPEGSIAPSGWLRRYKRMYKQKEITFE